MADAPTLSPEVSRSVLTVARTLAAAARGAVYPPEHPAVRNSLDRLRAAIHDANGEPIMGKTDDPAFNQKLLRRFINLIGLFPIGTLVRLNTDAIGVVTHEHPSDPFRPQVKIVRDREGQILEESMLVNTWEPAGRGDCMWAVVEAVDPEAAAIDPLNDM